MLQPLGLAAHSSVMIRDNTMLVVGGVRNGQLSSLVLTYSVDVGVWDVWRRGTVPGMLCVCVCVCEGGGEERSCAWYKYKLESAFVHVGLEHAYCFEYI